MSRDKLTWSGTLTMAVGGMVGGGIFSVLGVVVELAGKWAWLSFVVAGVIALLASLCYVALTTRWHRDGGSYGYLRQVGRPGAAGTLAWVLVIGYVLTMSVYAFTFGHSVRSCSGPGAAAWAGTPSPAGCDQVWGRSDHGRPVDLQQREVSDGLEQIGGRVRVEELGAHRDAASLGPAEPEDRHRGRLTRAGPCGSSRWQCRPPAGDTRSGELRPGAGRRDLCRRGLARLGIVRLDQGD